MLAGVTALAAAQPSPGVSDGLTAALIGGACIILAAVISGVYMWLSNRRAIGRPNGSGSVIDMLTTTLTKLGEIDGRSKETHELAAKSASASQQAVGMVEAMGNQLADHEARLRAFEEGRA